jgi:hypothetical protein
MKIRTFFTQQEDVRSIILEHLDQAKKSAVVAVACFTDTAFLEKHVGISEEGVVVRIISLDVLRHDEFDRFCKIIDNNINKQQ